MVRIPLVMIDTLRLCLGKDLPSVSKISRSIAFNLSHLFQGESYERTSANAAEIY